MSRSFWMLLLACTASAYVPHCPSVRGLSMFHHGAVSAASPLVANFPGCKGIKAGGGGQALAGGGGLRQATRPSATTTRMAALGPIGPFAPFRSKYCASGEIDRDMSSLTRVAEELQTKFAGLMKGFQSGMPPAPDQVRKVAEEMDGINEQWRVLLTRLRLADDFQALQFFKLTEARLAQSGISLDDMQVGMTWQIESMKAFADNKAPPPMPPSMQALMDKQQQNPGAFSGIGGGGSGVTAMPFLPSSKALQSEVVAQEFQALVSQHKALVEMGGGYGKWDREGRKMYIDQMEQIEDRWGVFLGRFELMGEMNPEFVEQTQSYLDKLQLKSVDEFKKLLKETRDAMRRDAEGK